MSSLTLRTPVSPATARSAAARSAPKLTVPVSVTLPPLAVASTPSGTVTFSARALFAVVVSIASSRKSASGSTTSRWLYTFVTPVTRCAAAAAARYCG